MKKKTQTAKKKLAVESSSSRIQVGIRLRPKIKREEKEPTVWRVDEDTATIHELAPAHHELEPTSHKFDAVFSKESSNEDIFDKLGKPLVNGALVCTSSLHCDLHRTPARIFVPGRFQWHSVWIRADCLWYSQPIWLLLFPAQFFF